MDREYDILMQFTYFDNDYVLYTDNTYDSNGIFNVYGARVDSLGRLKKVNDVDMDIVFEHMIEKYKNDILKENV